MIVKKVKDFLKKNVGSSAKALLGFSGGADSTALLHLLLGCRKEINLELHVMHVDHSWRSESSLEAAALKKTVEGLGLPFYLETLTPPDEQKNLEAKGREERLALFQKKYFEEKFEVLLLAHQADDQIETVLKRLFEGAGFSSLGGIRPISKMRGMKVVRPLLGIYKKELMAWLRGKGIVWIEDPSNADSRFLRGRMRSSLFPILQQEFGKNIGNNLLSFAEKLAEVNDYLGQKLPLYHPWVTQEPLGECFDAVSLLSLPKLELKAMLAGFLESRQLILSRVALETLYQLLIKKKTGWREGSLFMDRGRLFILKTFRDNPPGKDS